MASTCDEDGVLVLHAPDGEEWARFLAARLTLPSYNINSTLIDITTLPASRTSTATLLSQSLSTSSSLTQSTSTFTDGHVEDAIYSNDGDSVDEAGAVYTNQVTIQDNNNDKNETNNEDGCGNDIDTSKISKHLSKSIDESRVCAIFISPDIVENESAFCVDMASLRERRTVFLLLGVDLVEVMQYFGPDYEYLSRCRCCFIDGTEETIRSGIVSIIEAYEDDEEDGDEEDDVYKIPNQPVQRITIEKVFPKMLTETEREVYVLLATVPEDGVQVVLMDSSTVLPLKVVCDKVYSFLLPPDIHGEVTFQLECQGRRFGEETVHSYSKLDLIQSILTSELNPHSLIASSLGLDKDDVGGLDTALAFKLQELAPVMTFKTLCPCEEALKNTEEQSTKMWPTLLHFAAELNLRLLCSELLRYPGMVAAACTENRAGEFPCQIANKKGFYQLENDLIEFMKRLRREVDPEYVSSSQCHQTSSKESSTTSLSEGSGTGPVDDPGTYCDMTETQRLRKPLLDRILLKPRAMSESSLFGEKTLDKIKNVTRPKRSLSGHSPSRAPVRSHSDRCDDVMSRGRYPQRPLPKRPDSPTEDDKEETYSNPEDSPRSNHSSPTSQKALKRLGITEEEASSRFSIVDPKIAAAANFYSATCPPGTLRKKLFDEEDRLSVSSNCDSNSDIIGWNTSADSKRGHPKVKEKLRGFFQKLTVNKKSRNPLDLPGLKNTGAKARRGSEPTTSTKVYTKARNRHTDSGKSHSFDEERDSGSYSDEEKNENVRVFKERSKPMARRVSRRIEYARKENYATDAPQLPNQQTEDKRATFKSFIL